MDLPGLPGRWMQCDGQSALKSVQLKHKVKCNLKQGSDGGMALCSNLPGETLPIPSRPHLLAPHSKPSTSYPPSLASLISLSSSPYPPPQLLCVISPFLYGGHGSNSGLSTLKSTSSYPPHSKTKLNCQLLQKVWLGQLQGSESSRYI